MKDFTQRAEEIVTKWLGAKPLVYDELIRSIANTLSQAYQEGREDCIQEMTEDNTLYYCVFSKGVERGRNEAIEECAQISEGWCEGVNISQEIRSLLNKNEG